MKNRDRFPSDTVTGACLITRHSRVRPGETVIDLQMDVESLPAYGRLCIHEDGVRLLNAQLGWKLRDPDIDEQVEQLKAANAELRAELAAARDHMRAVIKAIASVGIELERDLPQEVNDAIVDVCEAHDRADEVLIG